jgi:hypothetical protein
MTHNEGRPNLRWKGGTRGPAARDPSCIRVIFPFFSGNILFTKASSWPHPRTKKFCRDKRLQKRCNCTAQNDLKMAI